MPETIVSQDADYSTRFSMQRKVFRNPRGLKWYYALFYYLVTGTTFEIRIYRSPDGKDWTNYQVVKSFVSDIFDSVSLWWHDNGTELLLFIVYADSNGNMFYKRGRIPDSQSEIILEDETQFIWATAGDYATRPKIARAKDGFLWLTYNRYGEGESFYLACRGRDIVAERNGWTKVGAEPYLDAIDYPTNYVYTNTNGDTIGDFLFEDTTVGGSCWIDIYCRGDGDDTITVYVWDDIGKLWLTAGTITPATVWSWKGLDLTPLGFTSVDKINGIKMYMVYNRTAAPNAVEVDCARLRVAPDASHMVYLRASTKENPQSSMLTEDGLMGTNVIKVEDATKFEVGDYITVQDDTSAEFKQIVAIDTTTNELTLDSNLVLTKFVEDHAQALHWSTEYEIALGSASLQNFPTVVPLEATHDVLILYLWRNDTVLAWRRGGQEMSWDGSTFTEGFGVAEVASGETAEGIIPAVCDENNRVHYFHRYAGDVYHDYWVVGSGFNATLGVPVALGVNSASLSIDRTSSPNVLYSFNYQKDYKIRVRTTPVDAISWTTIEDISEEAILYYFSSSYQDKDKTIYLIYMRGSTVRFLEYPIILPPPRIIGESIVWIQQ